MPERKPRKKTAAAKKTSPARKKVTAAARKTIPARRKVTAAAKKKSPARRKVTPAAGKLPKMIPPKEDSGRNKILKAMGRKKYDEIMAVVEELKSEEKSPDDIAAALERDFPELANTAISSHAPAD
jgi:hypothetical protein